MSSARASGSRGSCGRGSETRWFPRPTTPLVERHREGKTGRVNVGISPDEKAEMVSTAEAFGLSVSEYLLRLHRLTVAIQAGRERGARGR